MTVWWPLFLQKHEQMERDLRTHFSGRGGYTASEYTGTVNPTNQTNANEVTVTCGLTSVKITIEDERLVFTRMWDKKSKLV